MIPDLKLASPPPAMSFISQSEVVFSTKHQKQASFMKAKPAKFGDKALPTLIEASESSFCKL